MEQIHLFLSGNVQGVGLRYTAKKLADKMGIFGYIKNLPDGRVEILAQGEKEMLDNYIKTINDKFDIKETQIIKSQEISNYSTFEIKF